MSQSCFREKCHTHALERSVTPQRKLSHSLERSVTLTLKRVVSHSHFRDECHNFACDTVTGDTVECHTETADNGVTLRQPYQWLITKTKLVSPHQPQVTVTRSLVLGSSSKDNDKYA